MQLYVVRAVAFSHIFRLLCEILPRASLCYPKKAASSSDDIIDWVPISNTRIKFNVKSSRKRGLSLKGKREPQPSSTGFSFYRKFERRTWIIFFYNFSDTQLRTRIFPLYFRKFAVACKRVTSKQNQNQSIYHFTIVERNRKHSAAIILCGYHILYYYWSYRKKGIYRKSRKWIHFLIHASNSNICLYKTHEMVVR